MKISRIEAIPFAIPYRKPLRFASGEVSTPPSTSWSAYTPTTA